MFSALRRWASLVFQVAVHEFDARYASRFGVLFAFLEPMLLVLFISACRAGIWTNHAPPFGLSSVLFYSSGIFPYYVFMRLSIPALRAGSGRGRGRGLPGVTRTMALIGATLSSSAIILLLLIIWFAGLYAYGIEAAVPFHLGSCVAAIAGLWVIGFGMGLCNSVIFRYFPLWRRIWTRARRPMMFISGVFFIADLLPLYIREIAVWNPLMHGIEWFRWGIYGNYPIMTLDTDYFLGFAATILFVGLIAYWSTLRYTR